MAHTRSPLVRFGVLALVVALGGAGVIGAFLVARPSGEDVPATPQALAWVASQHLPTPRAADPGPPGVDGIFVDLDYDPQGEGDATHVSVSVVPQRRVLDCEALQEEPTIDGCETRDGVTVFWQKQEPKEDPGVVYVEATKDGVSVVVFQQGPKVPRDIDDFEADASLSDMIAAAKDPRLDLTTTQEAIDGGDQLSWWEESPNGSP